MKAIFMVLLVGLVFAACDNGSTLMPELADKPETEAETEQQTPEDAPEVPPVEEDASHGDTETTEEEVSTGSTSEEPPTVVEEPPPMVEPVETTFSDNEALAAWLGTLAQNSADAPYRVALQGMRLEGLDNSTFNNASKIASRLYFDIDLSHCPGVKLGSDFKSDNFVAITLGPDVKEIPAFALDRMAQFRSLTLHSTTPPKRAATAMRGPGPQATDPNPNVVVRVPAESLAAYQADAAWNCFRLEGF
jgi:hypothetical protein